MGVKEVSATYSAKPSVGVPKGCKQTEVGVIPEDWDVKALKHISPSQSVGLVINPSTHYDESGSVPMLVGSDVKMNAINWKSARRISESSNQLIPSSKLRVGDLVTVRVGEPGVTAVVPPEIDGCNCASMMIVRRHESFNSRWLCYVMNSRSGLAQVQHVHYGTAQKQFNISDAVNFKYAVPPTRREQDAIAEVLSDADALIESLEQLLTKKRQLKQGAMQELLTGKKRLPGFSGEWQVNRLGELGSTYGGLTGKTKADFGSGVAQYVTFTNVMSNVLIDGARFERVQIGPTESQNRVMRYDLLFNGSSETPEEVAMCSLVTEDVPNLFLNSFCFGFRLLNGTNSDVLFLAYHIRSREGRELMKSLAQGSTRYNLSKRALLEATLRMPSKEEQIAIVKIFTDMDAELTTLEKKLAKACAAKQGMMQELLTGRIRLI